VLGLGLAYSFAYLLSSAWALQVMSYKVPAFSVRSVISGLWRPLLAAVLMAEAMWFVTRESDDAHGWEALGELAIGGAVGLIVYTAVLFALRVPELSGLRRMSVGPQPPVNPNAVNS
jgi:putative peptidoglycan lipid II flippase